MDRCISFFLNIFPQFHHVPRNKDSFSGCQQLGSKKKVLKKKHKFSTGSISADCSD
jgi:hypothetical protein